MSIQMFLFMSPSYELKCLIIPSGDAFHPSAYTFVPCIDHTNGSQLNGGCPASRVLNTALCLCSDGNTSGLHIDDIIPDIKPKKKEYHIINR